MGGSGGIDKKDDTTIGTDANESDDTSDNGAG